MLIQTCIKDNNSQFQMDTYEHFDFKMIKVNQIEVSKCTQKR